MIVFIGIGVLMILGIMRGGAPEGLWGNLALWTQGDAPFAGGFAALIGVAMIAGFSFQGTELVGITAGEAQDPQRTIPKAIKQIFWRILIFYVLSIIMIGLLLPYNDPRLLQSSVKDIAVSPFTLVLQATGVPAAASVMNAVILTALFPIDQNALQLALQQFRIVGHDSGQFPAIQRQLPATGAGPAEFFTL